MQQIKKWKLIGLEEDVSRDLDSVQNKVKSLVSDPNKEMWSQEIWPEIVELIHSARSTMA